MIFLMKLINIVVFTLIPILLYIIYDILYSKKRKENQYILMIILLISHILSLLFQSSDYKYLNIFINTSLFISVFKGYKPLSILFIIINIIFYYFHFNYFLLLVLLEYTLYILLFIILKNRLKILNLLSILILFKSFFMSFFFFYHNHSHVDDILYLVITIMAYYLIFNIIFILFSKKEDIKDKLIISKNLEDEKRLKNYMFKITHEIKNPIAVCKGYLDMINTNEIDKANRYINVIRSEINRTLTILEDILGYNKIKLEKDVMDIVMLLEEVYDSNKDLLNNKDINLNYNNRYDEVLIVGDYNRLKQVLINILKNATEAKKNNEVLNITLKLKVVNDNINIIIVDDGVGMEEEVLQNIGKEFFTTKKMGTGLGISISTDIIKKHDGHILYSSKKNVGTKVTIVLPINYKL